MDATIVVALIVAVSSLVPTFAVPFFGLLKQINLRKLELKEAEYQRTIQFKRTMYEDYLKALSIVISRTIQGFSVDLEEYSSHYALVMIYSTPEIKNLVYDIHYVLVHDLDSDLFQKMQSIISAIHLELNNLLEGNK